VKLTPTAPVSARIRPERRGTAIRYRAERHDDRRVSGTRATPAPIPRKQDRVELMRFHRLVDAVRGVQLSLAGRSCS
jgi:hypothetical protein